MDTEEQLIIQPDCWVLPVSIYPEWRFAHTENLLQMITPRFNPRELGVGMRRQKIHEGVFYVIVGAFVGSDGQSIELGYREILKTLSILRDLAPTEPQMVALSLPTRKLNGHTEKILNSDRFPFEMVVYEAEKDA
jgi:hypothetical protein